MNIVIPYCHKDAGLAAAQIAWMLKLDDGVGDLVKNAECLLLASKLGAEHSAAGAIAEGAKRLFKLVHFESANIRETGWPGGPNQMFVEALHQVVKLWPAGKFLWLEPDALPLSKDWYSVIKRDATGATFFGARVVTQSEHMSGVAVYPCNARTFAPMLELAANMNVAFDCYAAPEIVKKATWTQLIQHVPDNFPKAVLATTRVYHPIYPGFTWKVGDLSYTYKAMSQTKKFYKVQNASLPVRVTGYSVKFDPFTCVGNLPAGIYSTEDEAVQLALAEAVGNPRSGVKEIGADEYAACVKKKAGFNARRQSLDSGFLRPLTDRQGQVVVPKRDRSVTVEVRAAPSIASEPDPAFAQAVKDAVEDPVTLGKVVPAEAPPVSISKLKKA